MLKQAQSSSNRAGFVPDITTTSYSESMSVDFAILASLLLTPGMIRIDVDFTNVHAEAVDLRGFIALLCKALFLHSNRYLDS